MKLLLAGGGTAGHINPALAIAGYVCQREPATQILYVGAKGGMEERLVPQEMCIRDRTKAGKGPAGKDSDKERRRPVWLAIIYRYCSGRPSRGLP